MSDNWTDFVDKVLDKGFGIGSDYEVSAEERNRNIHEMNVQKRMDRDGVDRDTAEGYTPNKFPED